MRLFRRAEVWGLLALVLAGLAWVSIDQWRQRSGSTSTTSGRPGAIVHDLRITRAALTPHGSHFQLRIEFTARHEQAAPLEVGPPAVRLFDAAGREMPVFFAPGAFPTALPPGAVAASWIEFWLTNAQAASPLTLEVGGCQTSVSPPASGS
jgi:hypothetical protein